MTSTVAVESFSVAKANLMKRRHVRRAHVLATPEQLLPKRRNLLLVNGELKAALSR